jgi:Rrf2 family iron-sulfur cluster assembly transcriptional regulator
MKITAQEEYGIRLLIRIARHPDPSGITIPQLSEGEGLSPHYVAKLCRILRLGGFINSTRGKEGGYLLAIPPSKINMNKVLHLLGGKMYGEDFCTNHSGLLECCINKGRCKINSVWRLVQQAVDDILNRLSLQDVINMELLGNEIEQTNSVSADLSSPTK